MATDIWSVLLSVGEDEQMAGLVLENFQE